VSTPQLPLRSQVFLLDCVLTACVFLTCDVCSDAVPAALGALDNLKAKLKAAFKKKGEKKPAEDKPADAKPADAAATTTPAAPPTETKPSEPAPAGEFLTHPGTENIVD